MQACGHLADAEPVPSQGRDPEFTAGIPKQLIYRRQGEATFLDLSFLTGQASVGFAGKAKLYSKLLLTC